MVGISWLCSSKEAGRASAMVAMMSISKVGIVKVNSQCKTLRSRVEHPVPRLHQNPATLVTPGLFDTCFIISTCACTRSYRERNERPTSEEGEKAMTMQVTHPGAVEPRVQRRDICAQHASQAQQ